MIAFLQSVDLMIWIWLGAVILFGVVELATAGLVSIWFVAGSLAALAGAVLGGENVSRVSVIPPWLLLFAVVFSVSIGLGSGYYPANKAVQIPALEAIKSE